MPLVLHCMLEALQTFQCLTQAPTQLGWKSDLLHSGCWMIAILVHDDPAIVELGCGLFHRREWIFRLKIAEHFSTDGQQTNECRRGSETLSVAWASVRRPEERAV